ncbi:hypothetical protein [Pseudacidovorax sp. NFM-22]|uniref:hypothetical protein n=1 Tax=Pseudacidovorax sp. NFM-22 TaxID=2744469 RepID=UPI001F48CEF0|nr:hypothetical protein [Pseudacidovorax sp. NFM-22]
MRDHTPRSIERCDSSLSNEQVEALWKSDPQRAFIEWTYRMNEIDSLLDGDLEFAQQLSAKLKAYDPEDIASAFSIPFYTEMFANGAIGRARWQMVVRQRLAGIPTESVKSGAMTNEKRSIKLRQEAERLRKLQAHFPKK